MSSQSSVPPLFSLLQLLPLVPSPQDVLLMASSSGPSPSSTSSSSKMATAAVTSPGAPAAAPPSTAAAAAALSITPSLEDAEAAAALSGLLWAAAAGGGSSTPSAAAAAPAGKALHAPALPATAATTVTSPGASSAAAAPAAAASSSAPSASTSRPAAGSRAARHSRDAAEDDGDAELDGDGTGTAGAAAGSAPATATATATATAHSDDDEDGNGAGAGTDDDDADDDGDADGATDDDDAPTMPPAAGSALAAFGDALEARDDESIIENESSDADRGHCRVKMCTRVADRNRARLCTYHYARPPALIINGRRSVLCKRGSHFAPIEAFMRPGSTSIMKTCCRHLTKKAAAAMAASVPPPSLASLKRPAAAMDGTGAERGGLRPIAANKPGSPAAMRGGVTPMMPAANALCAADGCKNTVHQAGYRAELVCTHHMNTRGGFTIRGAATRFCRRGRHLCSQDQFIVRPNGKRRRSCSAHLPHMAADSSSESDIEVEEPQSKLPRSATISSSSDMLQSMSVPSVASMPPTMALLGAANAMAAAAAGNGNFMGADPAAAMKGMGMAGPQGASPRAEELVPVVLNYPTPEGTWTCGPCRVMIPESRNTFMWAVSTNAAEGWLVNGAHPVIRVALRTTTRPMGIALDIPPAALCLRAGEVRTYILAFPAVQMAPYYPNMPTPAQLTPHAVQFLAPAMPTTMRSEDAMKQVASLALWMSQQCPEGATPQMSQPTKPPSPAS